VEKKSLQGTELRAKTLGIIGLGRIGMEVARRARGFGMELVGHDPFVSVAVAKEQGIRVTGLDELMRWRTTLRCTLGLRRNHGDDQPGIDRENEEGRAAGELRTRELVNEADLAEALKQRRVAAAAIDVFAEEPPKNSPLLALDNVLLTPHVGGRRWKRRSRRGADCTAGEGIPEARSDSECGERSLGVGGGVRRHAALHRAGGTHGAFLSQVSEGSIEEISIRYSGHIAEWKTELIRNGAIKGILNQALEEKQIW